MALGDGAIPSGSLRDALERHRDDDAPRLDFNVPLDRLMDRAHCRTFAADLQNAGTGGWEIVKATPTAWRKIPAKPGLYMFVWQTELEFQIATSPDERFIFPWVLYVGKAGGGAKKSNLKERYKGEYSKFVGGDPDVLWSANLPINREGRLQRYLCVEPLNFWYHVTEDGADLASLEQTLFKLLAPPLNASGSNRLRPVGKPNPAF